jgi:dTMP kinase
MQAPLIVFCGMDGAGKTLQARQTAEWLSGAGWAVRQIKPLQREGSAFFRTLEAIKAAGSFPKEFIVLLFAFECLRHIREEILPALESGQAVICDRYIYSHEAYALAQGVDFTWGRQILDLAPRPDLTFLLDLSEDLALKRIYLRGKPLTGDETPAILRRVRAQFLRLVEAHGMVTLDAARSCDEVQSLIREQIRERWPVVAARAAFTISEVGER